MPTDNKRNLLSSIKAVWVWYGLAAAALAGNMYFERAAVVGMTELKTNQGNILQSQKEHEEMPGHTPTELRLQRTEMIVDRLAESVDQQQEHGDAFMEAVNTNFVAIQTQIKITQLAGEKRDTTKEAQSLERVIERMELANEVVPMLYRQNLSDAKDEAIELQAAINRLNLH